MPTNAHVINVSAMGPLEQIEPVIDFVSHQPHLVAYSGMAIRDKGLAWLDVHHSQGSKANGVRHVAERSGFEEVIAFGELCRAERNHGLMTISTKRSLALNACPLPKP